MGNPLSVRPCGNFQNKDEEGWWGRVKENARVFFRLRGAKVCAVGGVGAFDLLDRGLAPGTRQRQAVSILLHGVAIAALLLAGSKVVPFDRNGLSKVAIGDGKLPLPLDRLLAAIKPQGAGKGSNHDLLPPSTGSLPPRSPIVLVRPHLPDEKPHEAPVAPTIFDANAQMPQQQVQDLGLPWMKDRNNSNGTDGGNTFGTKRGDTIGSTDGIDAGESGSAGPYAPGLYPVRCVYCPDPEYTDEARHEKLQGSVTLRVLVTKDGRVGQVKLVKGLGLGLDDRAVAAVRTWRFQPARDANKNAITEWVTVEATYRLF